jgi:hypothetical protein
LPISQNNSCESLIKKMTLIAQAVGVLFIGYHTMGCGAVFDERPPWHPGVLWWFFLNPK